MMMMMMSTFFTVVLCFLGLIFAVPFNIHTVSPDVFSNEQHYVNLTLPNAHPGSRVFMMLPEDEYGQHVYNCSRPPPVSSARRTLDKPVKERSTVDFYVHNLVPGEYVLCLQNATRLIHRIYTTFNYTNHSFFNYTYHNMTNITRWNSTNVTRWSFFSNVTNHTNTTIPQFVQTRHYQSYIINGTNMTNGSYVTNGSWYYKEFIRNTYVVHTEHPTRINTWPQSSRVDRPAPKLTTEWFHADDRPQVVHIFHSDELFYQLFPKVTISGAVDPMSSTVCCEGPYTAGHKGKCVIHAFDSSGRAAGTVHDACSFTYCALLDGKGEHITNYTYPIYYKTGEFWVYFTPMKSGCRGRLAVSYKGEILQRRNAMFTVYPDAVVNNMATADCSVDESARTICNITERDRFGNAVKRCWFDTNGTIVCNYIEE